MNFQVRDLDGSGPYVDLYGATGVALGEWHHIAGVRQGSEIMLYIDGQFSNSVSWSGVMDLTNPNQDFRIGGGRLDNENMFIGMIDEVRLVKWALTPEQFLNSVPSSLDLCQETNAPGADVNRDCRVDAVDLGQVGRDWLQCSDPKNPDCW